MRNYSKKINDKTAQIIGYKTQKERIQNELKFIDS